MQIVESLNEGLKRAFKITITAKEIDARIGEEVKKVAPQIKMPGFRPGKVPANLVRKMHGDALHQDALNAMIQSSVDDAINKNSLRPATQPHVHLDHDYKQGDDANVDVHFEILPAIELPSIDGLTLTRMTVEPSEEEVNASVARLAEGQKSFEAAAKTYKAASGDQVVIDFEGKVDDVAFEGGKGEAMPVEIGSGQLIPGFEDQLIGLKAGQESQVKVKFPADYGAKDLADKDAVFDIKVVEVRKPVETKIDDEMAKKFGLESLEQLQGLMKGQLEQELNGLTRTYMKRQLLDSLAASHDFEVPPSMVEAEFNQIWQQLEQEAAREEDVEAAKKEMEDEREDYRSIAERRVRLGLLLSEIGQANGVEVSQQEMNMLVQQAAQQYREEDRRRFVEYLQQNPMAAAQLRAPLFEDKVVDFLFDKAEVTDKVVTKEELEAAIEADPETAAPKKAAAKKKAPAKKAEDKKPAAKKAAPKKEAAEKEPAKKKAAPKKDKK
ncbi:trigger factor [Sphingorhabdus lutea]|uniref:Trigger factor n=1 Tax=Sphingorhabdus lutea TaxID=1913578 RepID=A0A1L3JCD7_9SPHN|nr:trigger factor [Sphingorhabdus lutea]APG62794.1 trigger factor [Sphingorhabdus lutea]